MAEIKKIPCRVCGKSFKPCGYCQSHSSVFRWRNFACSMECAQKYIADTIAYREGQNKDVTFLVLPEKEETTVQKEKSKKNFKKKTAETTNNFDSVEVINMIEDDKKKETD